MHKITDQDRTQRVITTFNAHLKKLQEIDAAMKEAVKGYEIIDVADKFQALGSLQPLDAAHLPVAQLAALLDLTGKYQAPKFNAALPHRFYVEGSGTTTILADKDNVFIEAPGSTHGSGDFIKKRLITVGLPDIKPRTEPQGDIFVIPRARLDAIVRPIVEAQGADNKRAAVAAQLETGKLAYLASRKSDIEVTYVGWTHAYGRRPKTGNWQATVSEQTGPTPQVRRTT